MAYNYANFPLDLDAEAFEAFPSALQAGAPAPSGTLTDLATGAKVELASLWKSQTLVLEFGSIT